MNRLPEEDWIVFKRHHLAIREAYVNKALQNVFDVMHGDQYSRIEMFEIIAEIMKNYSDSDLNLFGDYRRSTAIKYIRSWIIEGLLSDDQLLEYSDEVKSYLDIN